MFEWMAANAEEIKSVIMLIGTFVTVVVLPILVASGRASKEAGRAAARAIETAEGAAVRLLNDMQKDYKDGVISTEEVAKSLSKAIKREATEQAFRSGLNSVVGAMADMAAVADPKEEKRERPVLSRIFSAVRPRILGG